MSDTVTLALIAVASPVVMGLFVFITQRANKREDWARQDTVAGLVAKVAVAARSTKAEIKHIRKTGDATHILINSQRTEMLRTFALQLRVAANDHPEDQVLSAAADAAEAAVTQNVAENADPATKIGAKAAPVRVEVVNTDAVRVDQV